MITHTKISSLNLGKESDYYHDDINGLVTLQARKLMCYDWIFTAPGLGGLLVLSVRQNKGSSFRVANITEDSEHINALFSM